MVAALVLAAALLPLAEWIQAVSDRVAGLGVAGIAIFCAGYVLAILLLVPSTVLAIAAGMVFGMPWGGVIAVASATIGATLAFLIGRYLARARVKGWVRRHEKFRAVDEAIGERSFRIIVLMRLSPLVPASLSNYFYGVTKARLPAYVAASAVGMTPGICFEAYLGHMGMTTIGAASSDMSAGHIALLGAGLVMTAVLTWYLARVARRALKQHKPVTESP